MSSDWNSLIKEHGSVKLTEIQSEPVPEGISIVSCCMNRNTNLKKALSTWLKLEVDEIIIVDWCSTVPVAKTLAHINDPRIKIIRVENESRWVLTYAFNVGLRLANYKTIYKFDADIEVSANFLANNQFGEGEFIRGHWKVALDQGKDSQVYINGSFGCNKDDLVEIGFYNEFIRTYGWDDSDLYTRLAGECGLKTKYLTLDSLHHIEQMEDDRTVNQDVTKLRFLGEILPTEFNNQFNKYLVSLHDHWGIWHLQDYRVRLGGKKNFIASRISKDFEFSQLYLDDAYLYASIYFIRNLYKDIFSSISEPRLFGEQLYDLYKAGIDFDETKSMLALEDIYPVLFAGNSNVYFCVKQLAKRMLIHPLNRALIYVTRPKLDVMKRIVINSDGIEFVVTFLPMKRYQTILDLRANVLRLKGDQSYCLGSDVDIHELSNFKVLATSVYDEKKPQRLQEYLSCIKKNVDIFDALVFFYEESDGSFLKEVMSKFDRKARLSADCEIFVININERPTFRTIFDNMDLVFAGAQVYVTNADIAFDQNVNKISKELLSDNFFVLSRKETIPYSQFDSGYIMGKYGLPNTFSADVWIYQAPIKYRFRADFAIGTFHCDSYLNYHIGKSGYNIYNPCLDIPIFHVHDESINSSELKRTSLATEIQTSLDKEIRLCGGEFPIVGVQWCRSKDSLEIGKANQLVYFSDFNVNIDIKSDGSNLFDALIKSLMCMNINSYITCRTCVWLSVDEEACNSGIADILFGFKEILNHPDLLIGVSNRETNEISNSLVDDRKAVSDKELLYTYNAALLKEPIEIYGKSGVYFEGGPTFGVTGKIKLAFNIDASQSTDLSVYLLLKALSKQDKEYCFSVLSSLNDRGHSVLKPLLADLSEILADESDARPWRLLSEDGFDECWAPDISFITSVYKGDEYFQGFLDNITAALLESNGEVIFIDGASPGREEEIFAAFIDKYPALNRRMKYIRLSKDPGLYECWRHGIEISRADIIGNANLDDRRSPFQAKAMLAVLHAEPGYAGSATAIRATTAKNTGWYELTSNDYWFDVGFDDEIKFESLSIFTDEGLVKSQNIMHCMPIWRKALHQKYGFFDEDKYGTSADWAFWLECTKNGEVFHLIDRVMSQYYINQDSHNRINDPQGVKENRIIKDYFNIQQSDFEQQ